MPIHVFPNASAVLYSSYFAFKRVKALLHVGEKREQEQQQQQRGQGSAGKSEAMPLVQQQDEDDSSVPVTRDEWRKDLRSASRSARADLI